VSPILLNFEERSLPLKSYAALAVSFDHLVGCGEEHGGNLDVKRHGGRQTNNRIEFCRLSGAGLARWRRTTLDRLRDPQTKVRFGRTFAVPGDAERQISCR
jgi:hypothetical protein